MPECLFTILLAALQAPEMIRLIALTDPATFDQEWTLLCETAREQFMQSKRLRLTLGALAEARRLDTIRPEGAPRRYPQLPHRILIPDVMWFYTQFVALVEGRKIGLSAAQIQAIMSPHGNAPRPQHNAQRTTYDDMWKALLRGDSTEIWMTALYCVPHLRARSVLRACLALAPNMDGSRLMLTDAIRHMIEPADPEKFGHIDAADPDKLGRSEEGDDAGEFDPEEVTMLDVDPAEVEMTVAYRKRLILIARCADDADLDPADADDPVVPAAVLLPPESAQQRDAASNLLSQDKFRGLAIMTRMIHLAHPDLRPKAFDARDFLTEFYPSREPARGWPSSCLPFHELFLSTKREGRATNFAAWLMLSRLAYLYLGAAAASVLRDLYEGVGAQLTAEERFNALLVGLVQRVASLPGQAAVHREDSLNFFAQHARGVGGALWCLLILCPVYEMNPPTLSSFAHLTCPELESRAPAADVLHESAAIRAERAVLQAMVRLWAAAAGRPPPAESALGGAGSIGLSGVVAAAAKAAATFADSEP